MHEDRANAGKGDCINCTQCVQVCPTGIDIRNGTQLECINCACCIDACNSMMDAVGQPRQLIRYASEKMIAEGSKFKLNVRTIAYSVVLVVLLGLVGWSLAARTSVEATILRAPGMLYQEQGQDSLSNLYTAKLVNKTNKDLPISFKLLSPTGDIKVIGDDITVKKESVGEIVFFVILEKDKVKEEKQPLEIGVYSGDREIDKIRSTFLGPPEK